jgi:hypothetical protein
MALSSSTQQPTSTWPERCRAEDEHHRAATLARSPNRAINPGRAGRCRVPGCPTGRVSCYGWFAPSTSRVVPKQGVHSTLTQAGIVYQDPHLCWSGRPDLNRRPLPPQGSALPPALRPDATRSWASKQGTVSRLASRLLDPVLPTDTITQRLCVSKERKALTVGDRFHREGLPGLDSARIARDEANWGRVTRCPK